MKKETNSNKEKRKKKFKYGKRQSATTQNWRDLTDSLQVQGVTYSI